MDWITEAGALTTAVVAVIALVTNRRRHRSETEKLNLEIRRLHQSPEVVADRREVYDRLREVVHCITTEADATHDHISLLHKIRHDATLCFPDPILDGLRRLIGNVVSLHVTNKRQDWTRNRLDQSAWEKLCDQNDAALRGVVEYEQHMLDAYKAHLTH